VQLFSVRREQGRLDEALPMVETVTRLDRAGSTWRPALALLYAELGMGDEAITELEALTADRVATVPRDGLWYGSLAYLADACTTVGHQRSAATLYDELVGWRGFVVEVGHLLAAHGAVDRLLGRLAALLGHDREAEIHFDAALRIDEAARMPVWLAHSRLDAGTFLIRRGHDGDVERARQLLAAALATAERLGMPTVASAARAELDVRQADPPVEGSARLTDRELDVLELIAEGRSNREIGRQLHISQHTAANHVRSILMKTECANRTEAAAWALRHQVSDQRRASNASGTN
jgi:DNA-binding CsgD family transcriptional regulator